MKGGVELCDKAEEIIYKGLSSKKDKADMLSVLAIFSGMVSPELPSLLISRRRDILIESAAYDIIKMDGYREGLEVGMEKGMEKGIEKGVLRTTQNIIIETLETRFELIPDSIARTILIIEDQHILKSLFKKSMLANSLEEFKTFLNKAINLQ